jgi:hypothetical protein
VHLRLNNFREWGQLLPTAKTGKSSFCTVRILRVPNVGPATLPKLPPTPGKEKFKNNWSIFLKEKIHKMILKTAKNIAYLTI